jgi:hypothetical protein
MRTKIQPAWCVRGCVARALKNSDWCRACWQRWWEGLFK